MFTFHPHVECLLLLVFLGCLPDIVKFQGFQPMERSRKRVQKVLAFYSDAGTPQYLRRTVRPRQLLSHIQNTCGQLCGQAEPLLVRLAKRSPSKTLSSDFARIIGPIHLGPDLDVSVALALLLAVAMEVVIRFREYSQWPYLAYTLSSKYNLDGYISACADFLASPMSSSMWGSGFLFGR